MQFTEAQVKALRYSIRYLSGDEARDLAFMLYIISSVLADDISPGVRMAQVANVPGVEDEEYKRCNDVSSRVVDNMERYLANLN